VKVTICDYENCDEYAALYVELLSGDAEGTGLDACGWKHAKELKLIYELPPEEATA
jgi:hypothetical protein